MSLFAFASPAPTRVSGIALRIALAALVLTIAACATRTSAPVVERPAPPHVSGAPPTPPPEVTPPAAVVEPPPAPTYTVKPGDSLHRIALDNGLDYRELAAWNNIENVNLIHVGQVLRLAPPGVPGVATEAAGVTVTPLRPAPAVVSGEARPMPTVPRNSENYKSQPKALKEPYSEQAMRDVQRQIAAAPPPAEAPPPPPAPIASAPPAAAATAPPPSPGPSTSASASTPVAPPPSAAPTAPSASASVPDSKGATAGGGDERIDWLWPANGKLVTGFSDTANLKGIDIAGKAGAPVFASAAGKVVYAGTGLRGYGKLVIVKHNNTYLSAYAHNSDILVKEGQQVARGQKIAEMGNTDSDQVKLHFEIRRLGKPVDPLKYLPPT
jgi:lipoprotein NlpD